MIRQLSLPTWFMSLSAADIRWTDLLKMLAKLNDGIGYSEKELEHLNFARENKAWSERPSYMFKVLYFSLLFGKCVNWSIDKTIYFSCHYIQSNDSLTALDANNSWLPHYHKYMYWVCKCTGKCTDIEGFLISLIQIIQAFFLFALLIFQQKCQSLLDLM